MTTIIIQKTKSGQYKGFTCKGHAGYAAHGRDIVCASISVLVINTINSLELITKESLDVETDENTGFIKCIFSSSLQSNSITLVDSMILGLQNIMSEYGERFLRLKFEEV